MALSERKPLNKRQMTILRNLAYYGQNGIAMAAPAVNDDTHTLMGRGLVDAFHNKMGFMRYRITEAGRRALSPEDQSDENP